MLKVNQLTFGYQEKEVIKPLNFSIDTGQSVAIMGKSGSGKSTLIKLLYGLLDANQGTIEWKDKKILGPAYHLVPGMDFMKYVAQDFDLMPYTSIRENIGHFLSNFDLSYKKHKIDELVDLVGLNTLDHRKVATLSGGQMQRVALAKALASQPEVLLLDEPFSHLDHPQKIALSRAIFRFAKNNNITVFFATHIPEEALQFADQIIVLNEGEMIFNGCASEAYYHKKDIRVANLFGEMNRLSEKIASKLKTNEVWYRPHELKIETQNGVEATVKQSYFVGHAYLIELNCINQTVFVENSTQLTNNQQVFISLR